MSLLSFMAKQASKPSGWFGRFFAGYLLNKANASLEDMGMKLMNIQPDDHILEIGFGNGRLIYHMAKHLKGGKITGIEISAEMLRQARQRNKPFISSGKVELLESSVDKIPADDEEFDKIFTSNTIYFWPDPKGYIDEIWRTLRSGGRFYCALRLKEDMKEMKFVKSNPDIFRNMYSAGEIEAFLIESGFRDVKIFTERESRFTNVVATGIRRE